MHKKKNLIIGANSFLSKAISQLLLSQGHYIEGIIHKKKDKLLPNIIYHSNKDLYKIGDDFDAVYIISAHIPTNIEANTHTHLFETNIALTEKVCKQFPNAKIILASSVSVYGEQVDILDENSINAPTNVYGISKLWGEYIVKQCNRYAIVRISSMYGEGMNLSTFLPRTILQALDGKIVIWGNGLRQQNYISVKMVAQYLVAAADYSGNGIFLAVDEKSYSNVEIAEFIQESCQCQIDFFGNDNSSSYYYNNNETKQKLHIQQQEKLKENLQDLIQWIKKM